MRVYSIPVTSALYEIIKSKEINHFKYISSLPELIPSNLVPKYLCRIPAISVQLRNNTVCIFEFLDHSIAVSYPIFTDSDGYLNLGISDIFGLIDVEK